MQKRSMWGACLIVLGVLVAGPTLRAQGESTSNPPLYIYVSNWDVPRAQWPAMEKSGKEHIAVEEKLLDEGTITGYGLFTNLIHTEGEPTHGDFIFASSEGNVVKALAAFAAEGDSTAPVLAASKHSDDFLVSRLHNMRPGTYDGAYLAGAGWQVKPGQMQAFREMVEAAVVPVVKKELEAGALIYYSMDSEDYHTHAPGMVDFVFMATNAAGLDKVNAAFEAAFSKNKEIGPAVAALTVGKSHRDFLYRIEHMKIK